jgi:demethylmenaquinone methyltransferase/2-methoxy-6-polyprenyl-1,4-benzoquinol methylase
MVDHFHLIAPFYDRLMGPPDAARLADLLKLPTAGWLLDGGGGTGRASFPLRPLVGHVVVSDVSGRMLARAHARSLNAVRAAVEYLPFSDGTFDRVLVVDALHHFTDQAAAIGDFVRVLKSGGRMVIEEFDANSPLVKLMALAERAAWMRSRFHRPQDIRDMVSACGLKVQVRAGRRLAAWVVADKG